MQHLSLTGAHREVMHHGVCKIAAPALASWAQRIISVFRSFHSGLSFPVVTDPPGPSSTLSSGGMQSQSIFRSCCEPILILVLSSSARTAGEPAVRFMIRSLSRSDAGQNLDAGFDRRVDEITKWIGHRVSPFSWNSTMARPPWPVEAGESVEIVTVVVSGFRLPGGMRPGCLQDRGKIQVDAATNFHVRQFPLITQTTNSRFRIPCMSRDPLRCPEFTVTFLAGFQTPPPLE